MDTSATVLAIYSANVTEETKTTKLKSGKKSSLRPKVSQATYIETISTSSEPMLGGVQIDQALWNIMIADAAAKLDMDVNTLRSDARALRKLWKETQRAKMILSANQEASVNIESLINDQDYRSKVTRTQLEDGCAAFATRFGHPIQSALAQAGLTIEDINSVILFGGNTRVPFVQSAIKTAISGHEEKIAQNVNTDEAAVLGAAYYGATQTRSVKSKLNFKVIESLGRDVKMEVVQGGDHWKLVPQDAAAVQDDILFGKDANMTSKRTLTFDRVSDVEALGEQDTLSIVCKYSGDQM